MYYHLFRQKRKERNLTLRQVGDAVGLKTTQVHSIETGKSKPSADKLLALLSFFGVTDISALDGRQN